MSSSGLIDAHDRTPRQTRHAHLLDTGHHLPLLLSVGSAIIVLHADKLGPVVALGDGLVLHELPSPHAARPDVYRRAEEW